MARFNRGFVKLYRSAIEGDIGQNIICLGIFAKILGEANLTPTTIRWNGQPRICSRGSLVISMRGFAEDGGIDVKTLRKHLGYLAQRKGEDGFTTIVMEMSREGTIITIPNYDRYHPVNENEIDSLGSRYGAPLGPPHGASTGSVSTLQPGCVSGPLLKNKELRIKNIYTPEFEKIWEAYPNKLNKSLAHKRFVAQFKTIEDVRALQVAVANYNRHLAVNSWKQPRGFESFLGSEKTGFFWRDFVNPSPSLLLSGGTGQSQELVMPT